MLIDKEFRFDILTARNLLFWMNDEQILKRKYKYRFNEELNLDEPKTYIEKLQWLKLHDHKAIYTTMVDKYEVKKYLSDKIGSDYIIPTIGVWDSFDSIDFDKLPDRFVLKCTHDSGGLVICRDKAKLNFKATKKKINCCLKRNYYYVGREWPYKDVKPRIIAEEYLEDKVDRELRDYKFFTFSGVPKVLYITQNRSENGETTADFFDMNFNHLDLKIDHENSKKIPHPPKNFEKMKELAAILSEGIPQLRVDFYEVNGKVYLGELTFFHCSGMANITPDYWENKLAEWVILPK